jgi:NodT family efflux transporter outer membrane factor (OMF) lipoprotein
METVMTTLLRKRPIPRALAFSLTSAAALTVIGCAVGPDFKQPEAPQVEAYVQKSASASTSANPAEVTPQQLVEGMDIPGQWWTLFHSQSLNDLINQAIKANPDLQAAQAALRNAQEIRYAGSGAFLPDVEVSLQPTGQQVSEGTVASSAANGATTYNLHTAQVSVGYAPDVFGGVRRGIESLQAQSELQRFQLEAAYLSLTSNVVNTVVQEASLCDQIAATRDMININTKLLDILRRQRSLGQSAVADVALQETTLAQAQAALPPLEKQLAQQRDMLATLVGRFPSEKQDVHVELASLQLPQTLPLSLPSKLVRQRPDIRAAEENLHSASAQVGVAVANRLPNITLSATLGSTAYEISQLFTAGTGFWTLAGSLTQPIFQGGALLHQQHAAEAAYDQAAAQYRSTVLSAFRDVADTLHAIQSDTQAYASTRAAERAAAKSLAIASRQLELGDISYASVLASQQAYQQTKLDLVQAQANRFADTAALFQSLGGGWWNRSDTVTSGIGIAHDEKQI